MGRLWLGAVRRVSPPWHLDTGRVAYSTIAVVCRRALYGTPTNATTAQAYARSALRQLANSRAFAFGLEGIRRHAFGFTFSWLSSRYARAADACRCKELSPLSIRHMEARSKTR
jgi:hypothetical protein